MWNIKYTDEFEVWWETLSIATQISIDSIIGLLEECGPNLPFPYSSSINDSKYSHMRELRIQHRGKPYRVLYAFDPHRNAILLLGGNKIGNKRWYDQYIPIADKLYKEYIDTLNKKR
jgi:hypothetical protein